MVIVTLIKNVGKPTFIFTDFLHFILPFTIVMNYYFNNYPRCKKELSKIITYKLRPMSERKILKQIIDRQPSEEFKPFPFNDES